MIYLCGGDGKEGRKKLADVLPRRRQTIIPSKPTPLYHIRHFFLTLCNLRSVPFTRANVYDFLNTARGNCQWVSFNTWRKWPINKNAATEQGTRNWFFFTFFYVFTRMYYASVLFVICRLFFIRQKYHRKF